MTQAALMKFTPSCMSLMPAALAISSSVTCTKTENTEAKDKKRVKERYYNKKQAVYKYIDQIKILA